MMSWIDSRHRKISTCLNIGNQFGTSLCTHISNFDDIRQCWIFAVLWQPFWKWRPVEIFQCQDIIIYPHIKFWWYRTMLNFYRPFFMPCQHCPISSKFDMLVDIDSRHWKISSSRHFQNGRHNTAQIQHCPISKTFFNVGNHSGNHYLPTYQILMISDNVEFLPPIFYAMFWQPW
jgi:hypothetical protein